MDVGDLLQDLFGRVREHVDEALDGLEASDLTQTVVPGTNPIGWLIWHLTRVEDEHMGELLDVEQVWVTGDWAGRFGLEPDPSNNGYGHGPDEVAAVQPGSPDVLVEYYTTVADRTRAFLRGLVPEALDRVVDERWDPPVTLGVRLISIADDQIQHAGQAAYLRGLLQRGATAPT